MTRRSARSAAKAQVVDVATSQVVEQDRSIACGFLYSLDGVHQPQNHWFVVPTGNMNCIVNPQYESPCVLSDMIGVDGAAFHEALFCGKSCRIKREQFLSDTFGVTAILHRNKVLCINFRPGAKLNLSNIMGEVPPFCCEAIKSTKDALEKDVISTKIVHDFMNSLKSSSEQFSWYLHSPLRQTLADITDLIFDDDDIAAGVSQNTEYTPQRDGSNSTSAICLIAEGSINTCDYVPIVSPTAESSDREQTVSQFSESRSSNFRESISVSIVSPTAEDFGEEQTVSQFFGSCGRNIDEVPIVSPTAEASGEEQTASQFFSRVINNSTTVEEDSFATFSVGEDANPSTPLRSMLKLKYPRKSQQTVDNLNAGTELKWKEEENCTQYSKQSLVRSCASDVNAILHTASTQDPRRAAQILKHIVENNPLLQNAIVEELSEFSKKKKNKKVLQKIGESINVYTSELDAIIVNNINAFSNALHSNGTRLKSDQEAINTVHTAVMYKAEDSIMKRIIQRIHIPKAAVDKALTRMRQHDTDIKLHYKHGSRKIRKDEKRIASLKYVRGFCHNNNWDRSTKVDTGEYRLVNSTDENGNVVKCMVRRWEDLPTRSAVYSKWHNSEQAKQFAVECKLNPICKTIFWKNVCPCCRFGTKDMCSDQVMTGLEESRAAFEKALRDPNLSKDAFLCKCPYHEKEKERNPFVNYHTSDSEDESEAGEQGQGLDDGDSASASDSESDSGGFCRAYSKSWLGVFLRQQGETIIHETCCPAKQYPELERHSDVESKRNIPEFIHLDCVKGECKECGVMQCFGGQDITECPVFFPPENDIEDGVCQQKLYRVKRWESVLVDRTTKTQKELVEKRMPIGELVQHFFDCISAARVHYTMYKFVSWNHDLYKYNTKPSHNRIVLYTDFSANPDLTAARTSTGAADTHAVLAIFISFEYTNDADGNVVCTKKSHHFIGSSESAGKKNNWMYHHACLGHLIDTLKRQGLTPEVEEVTIATDRCSGQYLCRQSFLQLAKYSSREGNPVLKHIFAVVHRFKGDHDAEGKVVKQQITKLVLAGKKGATAWDFYATCRSHDVLHPKPNQKLNKLDERHFYYVSYDEDDYQNRNKGDHEGRIVLADMNNSDDAKRIEQTKDIYMLSGIPTSETTVVQEVSQERQLDLWDILHVLEKKNNDEENNDQFLARIENDSSKRILVLSEAEKGRRDCILIEIGEKDPSVLLTELSGLHKDYMTEFLYRAGKLKPPKTKKAMTTHISKWLNASATDRLYILRSRTQIVNLYNKMCPKPPSSKMTIQNMIGDIIGHDVSTGNDEEDDGNCYYLRKFNLPCGCQSCLSYKKEECISPFKKYMMTREVKIKQLPVERNEIELNEHDGLVDSILEDKNGCD